MLLVIDNYDSFTYNLVQYFSELYNGEIRVFRNDAITVDEVAALAPERIIISPGPCTPREAGISVETIMRLGPGTPLLGVCLGMQLMFEKSEEGQGKGLTLFRGKVLKFRPEPNLKVPHMGWNTLKLTKSKSALCKGLSGEEWVYYVHSFYPSPQDENIVRAWTTYGSQRFPAIIERNNVFGTQFHPEKSSKAGFKLISNFAKSVLDYSK